MSHLRLLWGVVAVGIYLLIVGTLLIYFAHYHNTKQKHYVKKDQERVSVSLASAEPQPMAKPIQKPKPKQKKEATKPKSRPKKAKKATPKPKPKKTPKDHRKKEQKMPIAKVQKRKKVHEQNRTKPSKKRVKDLFASVDVPAKPLIVVSDKPLKTTPKKPIFTMKEKRPSATSRIRDTLQNKRAQDSGVEDAYLAHVQQMLEDWPAQSDFAGEKVKVHLKIDPTGNFEFEIKRRSNNPDFNDALTAYLEQLQSFGFGPHKGSRTYLFEAEFVAKE